LPPVMSDPGMIRYLGYADLPAAQALRARLKAEQREHIDAGVHLIAVRSADGTLVVGDSRHYAATPDPFAPAAVDDLILDEYAHVFGTVIDYGSLAPMGAFVETFGEFGVTISIDEARGPMGMAKRPHIAAIMALPRIAEAWTKRHGHAPTHADIDAVYAAFVPKNIAVAARYATLIPGAAEVVTELRNKGIKIGSSTDYTREIMAEILPVAAA